MTEKEVAGTRSGSVERTLMKEEANEEENERELLKECKNYFSADHIIVTTL